MTCLILVCTVYKFHYFHFAALSVCIPVLKNVCSGVLYTHKCTAPDKKEGGMRIIKNNFSYFSTKQYVVTPHLNHLDETVLML